MHVCSQTCRQAFPIRRNQAPSFSLRHLTDPTDYKNHREKFPNGLSGSKLQDWHLICKYLTTCFSTPLLVATAAARPIITWHPRGRTREQISTKGTLNESSLDTDTGAAQRAMLLAAKAGKTLLRNHLALHQSLLPLSAGLSAAFLSVCLTSHQRLPRLLILILLLALAADQLTPDNDGQMLGYFGNIIRALPTKSRFNLVFTPEGGSHHDVLRLCPSIAEGRWHCPGSGRATPRSHRKGAASSVKNFRSAGVLLAETRAAILAVSSCELRGWQLRGRCFCIRRCGEG